MGFGLRAVPALDPGRGVGCAAGGPERDRARPGQCSDDRFHHHSRPSACRRRPKKAGAENQDLGRSRGGFSTKIHLRTNGLGLPVAIVLTGGETSDVKGYAPLMAEPGPAPKVLMGDKGYDA